MRVSQRASALYAELLEKGLAHEMRRDARIGADPDIGVGRSEVDRRELRVHVGEMQQRDLPLGVEAQQVVLGQLLLRQRAGRISQIARGAEHHAGVERELQKVPAGVTHSVPPMHDLGRRRLPHRASQYLVGLRLCGRPRAWPSGGAVYCRTAGVSTESPVPRHVT